VAFCTDAATRLMMQVKIRPRFYRSRALS